jgi:hypothetical protein
VSPIGVPGSLREGAPAKRWLADSTLDWLWVEAEKAGSRIYMIAADSLVDARIAVRHRGLRLTLAHLGGGAASSRCGAGQISERGSRGDRSAPLLDGPVPIFTYAHLPAASL